MAVFRVDEKKGFTVMHNYHLRDKRLSLKAKGLLSQMLSLPEDWDYTLTGLTKINLESRDAIRSAVRELEQAGYIIRRQTVDPVSGKFGGNEYLIFEKPRAPFFDKPPPEKPTAGKPPADNPTQLNTNRENTNKQNTDSIPSFPENDWESSAEQKRRKVMCEEEISNYRALILENVEYAQLVQELPFDTEKLDEIAELMVETVCSNKKTIRIAGSDFPGEVVRARLLKLNRFHIEFVLECLRKNTSQVRNMKQYLLTALFNAPTTMNNYYDSQVNHDLMNGL